MNEETKLQLAPVVDDSIEAKITANGFTMAITKLNNLRNGGASQPITHDSKSFSLRRATASFYPTTVWWAGVEEVTAAAPIRQKMKYSSCSFHALFIIPS